jgi:LPS sulfotransferase NodH
MPGKRSIVFPMWTGVRLLPWVQRLAANGFRIAPSRLPRAAAITAASAVGEVLHLIQWAIWGRGLRDARIEADPIVILGHWRSGTTLLHELLACDPRLCPPTTAQCACPSHFVLSEQFAADWLGFLLPEHRPMDAMRMGYERPQEDELALCNLGLPSPWWIVAFPNEPPPDPLYADLEQVSDAERRRWVRMWTDFLRHVQFEHRGRLLLKNPLHTYRVPLIREVFPRAEFIHIVRDPHDLVPSCLHFWRSMFDQYGLQRATGVDLEAQVLDSIAAMDARLVATWDGIPERLRFRIRYEDLVGDPLAMLHAIYAHFGWPGIEDVMPRWEAALIDRQSYRRNEHAVDDALRGRISARLADLIRRQGYPDRPGSS